MILHNKKKKFFLTQRTISSREGGVFHMVRQGPGLTEEMLHPTHSSPTALGINSNQYMGTEESHTFIGKA